MNKDIFQKIIEDNRELSALPQAVVEVIRITNDPDSSVADVANVIMKDPALTAKLLRIANSPYYGCAKKVTTVQKAALTLGMRMVTAIAVAASVYGMFNAVRSSIDRKRFWRHSLEVALASRMIARAIGHNPAEEAFVAGLLHDVGSLVMEAAYPDDFGRIWKLVESGVRLTSVEERIWGTNHARVGQFLLNQWGLPQVLSDAVGCHHDIYESNQISSELRLNQIVNLANHVSKFRIFNIPQPDKEEFDNKRILAANLNLPLFELGKIEEISISEVTNEAGYLEIEIGSPEEILRDANKLLFKQYLIAEQLLDENVDMQRRYEQDQVRLTTGQTTRKSLIFLCELVDAVNSVMGNESDIITSAVSDGKMANDREVIRRASGIISEGSQTVSDVLSLLKSGAESDGGYNERELEEARAKISLKIKNWHKARDYVEV